MPVAVKICGLTTPDAVAAAVEGGADWLGVVFFAPSPRAIEPEAAAELLDGVPEEVVKVGLLVDPDDATLDRVLAQVRLDMIQLHGRETPQRVEAIRQEFGRPVMKAISVGGAADLLAAKAFDGVADRLLFDARPPQGAANPGGNAQPFDWPLMADWRGQSPWMLAGGLSPDNLAQAVKASGATAVDVSSGVESARGVKDPDLIRRFLEVAARL
ncbi:phosphoribosylanthranilate isomerase [Roseospirillum parvum]|uniref:N-(5'-phosphoribosyl)anthranilate isomerase n=2 Tax=Roseospirillum parvum TaxID=83401 RepID=A0A1G8FRY2_9PROT|nr:phosphoribosylanthranilate isomerase [Roseospirillum parvum]SDH84884.1 phosphoribosylanthranilate isomerase [Roseospirillum parvum]